MKQRKPRLEIKIKINNRKKGLHFISFPVVLTQFCFTQSRWRLGIPRYSFHLPSPTKIPVFQPTTRKRRFIGLQQDHKRNYNKKLTKKSVIPDLNTPNPKSSKQVFNFNFLKSKEEETRFGHY